MAHDVFISYSSKDKLVADAVCATLEANKIRCWITPRDILPGQDWAESIEGAITRCKLLVLIFSSYSNNSKQVAREVSLAFNSDAIVIPFRIEDIEPKGAMKYYLLNTHWQDALTPPMENNIKKLVEIVSVFIGRKIAKIKEEIKISPDKSKEAKEQKLDEYEIPDHAPAAVPTGQVKKPQDLEIKKVVIKKQNKKKLAIILGAVGAVIIAAAITLLIKFPIIKTGKTAEIAKVEITTTAEIIAAETTVAETTAAKTTQESSEGKSSEEYSFYNNLREYAKKGEKYPGSPAKGYTLAFSDFSGGSLFNEKIFESIKTNWSNAGGENQKLYYFDNKGDAATALDNADKILALSPDVSISWQSDSVTNNIISSKFKEKNIPIIAFQFPIPGAILINQDEFQLGYLMGEKAVELIEGSNGISNIDKIIYLGAPSIYIYGVEIQEIFNMRKDGFGQALNKTYGSDIIESKFISIDCDWDSEETKKLVNEILKANPQMKNVVLASSAESFLIYSIDAIKEAKKWDSEKWIALTIDVVQKVVKQYINDGTIDAGIGQFPERYGEYLIPAALSLMNGEPIPQIIYMENEVISKDNINEFYDLSAETTAEETTTNDTTAAEITAKEATTEPPAYSIGDTGPAGGFIFYINPNYKKDGWRYLEAAPPEQGDCPWYNGSYQATGATATGVGSGKANTEKIVQAQGEGNYAAWICYTLEINGYDDWFLPSGDELQLMCNNLYKKGIGGFGPNGYWSSNENGAQYAFYRLFDLSDVGKGGYTDKSYKMHARPVRAF